MSLHNAAVEDDNRFSKEREIVRLLMKTAKYHVPRLSWRPDDAVPEAMEREGIMLAANTIAKPLTPAGRSRVIDKFIDVLWEEIRLIRKNRRITKI